ncbi:PAS domain-containing protein [Thalassospiraceae bacterium LMO-JJ14]|nr:PAS domain-containing protein [Thalassospiraceae bacterium LMO-JJ14]
MMQELEGVLGATTIVVLSALGLQFWTLVRSARHLEDKVSLTLFAASAALAARGIAALSGVLAVEMMGDILILAVSAALLAVSYLHKSAIVDLDYLARTLMDRSPNPIMIKCADGTYEYINPAFETAFEVSHADVIGRKAEEIWDDQLSNAAIEADQRVIETRAPSIHKVQFQTSDAQVKDWLVSKFAMPMPSGLLCIATVYTDFSEHVELEKRLAESETRIQTLLDNSPAPIYFKDQNLRFIMANRRYLEVYGVTLEQIRGKTSLEVFDDSWGPAFIAHDREILEKRRLIMHEESINKATFLTAKFPIINNSGELIGVGGIETDITDRVAVERAYRKARDEAEMANRSKSAFLANMSHELRTPLNSIIGFSDSLLAGTLGNVENPLHREYLEIIRTGGEHLLQLINDILDLSRIEAGKLKLEEQPTDLHVVFSDSIRLTAEHAGAEGIFIDNRIPDDLPLLMADERQLRQVLINLLSNAIKFTDPGGKITATARRMEGGGLEIRIADTGVGIDPENLKLVQQPFVQVADALTRKHKGSGLGLAIVQSIVTLHGGTFTLESTVGKGTAAIIALPPERVLP